MKHRCVRALMIMIGVGVFCSGGGPVIAQTIAVQPSSLDQVTRSILSRKVSLRFDSVSLKTAIDATAAQGNTRASYSLSLVEVHTRPVSVSLKDVSLEVAFAQVLDGTMLRVVGMPGGQLAIVRDEHGVHSVQDGVISGKVLHAKTKQPVAGAVVHVNGTSRSVTTESDGTYRIAVGAGTFTVSVRAIGMVRQTRELTVNSGQVMALDFMLEASASVLDEVVVTGTVTATERKAITTPITVITAEEIERRGITRIEQLFRGEIPGVFVLENGSRVYGSKLGAMNTSSVFSRGSSSLDVDVLNKVSTPLKTFIDGIELLDPTYLGIIEPQSIERIEVITGPQAATIYGSGAMGGVIQIFTKKGAGAGKPQVTVSLQYGIMQSNSSSSKPPMHSHSVSLASSAGPVLSYALSATYNYTGQWKPNFFNRRYGASIGATHVSGPASVSGSIGISGGSNGTGGANNGTIGAWDDFVAGKQITFSGFAHYFPQKISRSAAQTFSLNADYRAASWWQHRLTIGRSMTAFQLDPQRPIYARANDSLYQSDNSHGGRTTLGYNSTVFSEMYGKLSSNLTVGVNGSYGDQVNYSGGLVDLAATGFQSPRVTKTVATESWGGFMNWQIGFFDRLYVTLGLRAERNPSYGDRHKTDWTPTNGVAYTHEAGFVTLKLLGSYGQATRAPSPDMRLTQYINFSGYLPSQVVSMLASPNLTPEYERGPQGGVEVYFGNRGSLTVNRYVQKVTDLIQSVAVDSTHMVWIETGAVRWQPQYQYLNIATIRKHGWELTSSFNVLTLSMKGTYSWNDSRILSVAPGQTGAGLQFRYVPTHTGNLIFSHAHGGRSISLVMNWVGRRVQNIIDSPFYREMYGGANTRLPMYQDIQGSGRGGLGGWNRPGYVKSDLAASQQIAPWAEVTINVTNLGNSYGSEVGGNNPVLGRQTRFGVRLRSR